MMGIIYGMAKRITQTHKAYTVTF